MATYQWGERPRQKTQLFSAALKKWLPGFTVKALMTPEAQKANGSVLQDLIPDAEIVEISKGASDAENWAQFGAIVNAIPAGSTVYMDVTHGFRSLPIVTLLALAYLRSVRGVTLAGVLYGAWEPGRPADEITPVFDLTPFVSMLDWASAAERFIDTGDARKITDLLEGQPSLDTVVAPLAQLSGALALQRPVEASRAAEVLRLKINNVRKSNLPPEQGQFALALEHIEQRFEGIAHGQDAHANDALRVLKGQYRQIQFYTRGGQYAQAVELMYEWLTSVRFWGLKVSPIWTKVARQRHTPPLSRIAGKSEWALYIGVWNDINNLRNRFAHFNEFEKRLDETLTSHEQLAVDVKALVARLPAAVLPLGMALDEPHA